MAAAALGLPDGREGSPLVHRLVERSQGTSTVIDLSISVLHDADGLAAVTLSSADLQAMVPTTVRKPIRNPTPASDASIVRMAATLGSL